MYMYFLTKLFSQQAQVGQSHENDNVGSTGQGANSSRERKPRLGAGQACGPSSDRDAVTMMCCTRPGLTKNITCRT
jgi:hypothetical protein